MQITKKKVMAAVAGMAVVASAAAAFAFWTTSGTGKAETTAGTVGTLTVDVAVDNGSHPGDESTGGVAIKGTITDNTSSAVSVTSIAGDPEYAATNHVTVDEKHADCDLSAFAVKMDPITDSPVTLKADGGSTPFTGRLYMAETGKNQDACQGATLTVHLRAE